MLLLIDPVPVDPPSGPPALLLLVVSALIGLVLVGGFCGVALRERAALRRWVALRKRL